MFAIQKYQAAVVGQSFNQGFMTSDGVVSLDKGERVTLVEATTISGGSLFGIRKQSQKIVWLPVNLFGTFNKFIGAIQNAVSN